MSIGMAASVAAVAAAMAVGCRGSSVSIQMMSVRCLAIAVSIGFAGIRGITTDGQIALHVILGRCVRTINFSEQTIVRVLSGCTATWRFSISCLLPFRGSEDVRLHSVLVHTAWCLGLGVGTEEITAATAWRLQNFARALGVLSESNVETGGSHLGSWVR